MKEYLKKNGLILWILFGAGFILVSSLIQESNAETLKPHAHSKWETYTIPNGPDGKSVYYFTPSGVNEDGKGIFVLACVKNKNDKLFIIEINTNYPVFNEGIDNDIDISIQFDDRVIITIPALVLSNTSIIIEAREEIITELKRSEYLYTGIFSHGKDKENTILIFSSKLADKNHEIFTLCK